VDIQELDIRKKPILGAGAFHNVYDYALSKGKVIKTKQHGTLDLRQMKVFADNPQFFAKVYKYNDKWAIIEKLDVPAFKADENLIAEGIFKFIYTHPDDKGMPYTIDPEDSDASDIDVTRFIWYTLAKEDPGILKRVARYCPQPLFNDWVKWFKDLDNEKDSSLEMRNVDIHEANFGYNKEGELRLLDI